MSSMQEILDKRYRNVEKAQKYWHKVLAKAKIRERDAFILFPETDREINENGVKYIDTFLQRFGYQKAAILTCDTWVKENVCKFSDNICSINDCDQDEADLLIALYELYNFDPRFYIVSLDKPHSRHASCLVGVKGTTVEQLIAIGVYGIIPFRPLADNKKIL